jgi:hypothetical protein
VLAPRRLVGTSAVSDQFERDFSERRKGFLSNSCLKLLALAAFVRSSGEAISLESID